LYWISCAASPCNSEVPLWSSPSKRFRASAQSFAVRNFGEIETGVPEFRIGRQRFLQCDLGLVVLRLGAFGYAAQILRLGEVGLARIDSRPVLQA